MLSKKTPRSLPVLVLVCLSVLGLADPVSAQASSTGSIRGTVVTDDDERPLPARVWLLGSARPGPQNPQGTFRFDGLRPGRYTLRATYIGYVPVDTVVSVAAGSQLRLTIRLVSSPVQLSSMTIRETARDTVKKPVIPPKRDCGLLFFVSMRMSLCSSPAMFPRAAIFEERIFQGLNARILEAAQESVSSLGFVTEKIVQLSERTWLIVARDRVPWVDAGSTRVEVVEIGADNTAVRVTMTAIVSRKRETAARARRIIATVASRLR